MYWILYILENGLSRRPSGLVKFQEGGGDHVHVGGLGPGRLLPFELFEQLPRPVDYSTCSSIKLNKFSFNFAQVRGHVQMTSVLRGGGGLANF